MTLLNRLLEKFARPVATPSPGLPAVASTAPEEALAFTLSVDGVLLATQENPGDLHFHNRELFYEIPPDRAVCLVTGGAPTRADALPDAAQAITLVILDVSSLQGEPPLLSLRGYDDAGEAHCVERRVREGRNALRPAPPLTGATRAILKLSGSGRISFGTVKLMHQSAAAATVPPADTDPLLALVAPDHKAARLAGAEIPPPNLTSP